MYPRAGAEEDDSPAPIVELVPGIAAVIYETGVIVEHAFGEQLSPMNCQTFSCRFNSGT
jgi:hypothetical protein